MIDEILGAVENRTPEAIAAAVSRLIRSGRIASGDRLPTVRELAQALGVSPATVSNAWQALAGVGLITSRGRAGSFVLKAGTTWMPAHFAELAGTHVEARLDLSSGTPDPGLLPSLGEALARVPARADTSSYLGQRVLPELERQLRASWPYTPESLTILDGALDAISRSLDVVVRFGDRVLVEDPTFPPFFDLLEQFGVERVPVAIDAHGMRPDALAAALATNPAAIILQPRAQNPTGASMTHERAEQLAQVLRAHSHLTDPVIIEDDHSAEISRAPALSLGSWLPHRVLHVRSYAKSHGPDLRIGALAGPATLVDRIVARRMLGPGWTSRMLQVILYELLTAPEAVAQVGLARETYGARQEALAAALERRGLVLPPADGINLWLPVRDERAASLSLAAGGIRVAAGASFFSSGPSPSSAVAAAVGPEVGTACAAAAASASAAAGASAFASASAAAGAAAGAGASASASASASAQQDAGPAFVRVTAGLIENDVDEVAALLAAAAAA